MNWLSMRINQNDTGQMWAKETRVALHSLVRDMVKWDGPEGAGQATVGAEPVKYVMSMSFSIWIFILWMLGNHRQF